MDTRGDELSSDGADLFGLFVIFVLTNESKFRGSLATYSTSCMIISIQFNLVFIYVAQNKSCLMKHIEQHIEPNP